MRKTLFATFSVVVFLIIFVACRKPSVDTKDSYVQDQLFFTRYSFTTMNDGQPQSHNKDLIDTIILQLKESDLSKRFAEQIVQHFGYPDWNSGISLKNANGLKLTVQLNKKKYHYMGMLKDRTLRKAQ